MAAERDVVGTSKALALNVFERIDTAALVLEGMTDQAGVGVEAPGAGPLSTFFLSVQPVTPATPDLTAALQAAMQAATNPAGDVEPADPRRRARPRSLLLVLPVAAATSAMPAPPRIFLAQEIRHRAGHPPAWIAGQLRPRYLWGASDEFLEDHRTCVSTERNERLFCSTGVPALTEAGASTTLTGTWTLFLNARFGASSWTFRTSTPRPSEQAELPTLAYNLAWVLVGTLLLVVLLSLLVIRRTMEPLEELIALARRIPQGNYSPRERIHDEFGQLATAFDEMGLLVARQMSTLSALSELDRKILKRHDLREVIDLVLNRIQCLVPDAGVCVIDHHSTTGDAADFHLRPIGIDLTQRSRIPIPAGVVDGTVPTEGRHWSLLAQEHALAEPEATLFRLGARHACTFRLHIGDRVCGSVSLGLAGDTRPSADCLQEVQELGSRIAVAIAAKERDDLLIHQARHDALTGLPNRFAAQEMLAATIERASPRQHPFAVLFFDLDGFKAINDELGHVTGDRVLVAAANILARHFGAANFVARLGGDEFLVILHDRPVDEAIMHMAKGVIAELSIPVLIDGVELFIGTSAGIAVFPEHGQDGESLIRHADMAMYQAKAAGGERGVLFEERMNTDAADRIQLERDLRHAVQACGIDVHFQPVVDCRTGAIVGAEALARWQHPVRGAVSPATFIPLAEQSGLIEELGTRVLQTACRQFAAWKCAGHALKTIAVNVSGRQLQSENFVAIVRSALAEHGLRGSELEIEITESVLVEDMAISATRLEAIRQLGVSIAIDDFGTGYSSLAYLKNLPVDTLKIDREFVVDMAESEGALALVRAIVAMAHATGKIVVAEGIECQEQVELLRGLGCFKIQGFLYHRPMAADALSRVLAAPRRADAEAVDA